MIPLRDDTPSSSRPVVTVLLILICIVVFLYVSYGLGSEAATERVFSTYGATPAALMAAGNLLAKAPTLVTSLFLHGGWLHLIGNMWFLWIFGDNVEDRMGHGGFAAFYLMAGVAASATHVLGNQTATNPLIGASGAIAGVLGACTVLFPRARIVSLLPLGLFTRLIAIPAVLFLPLWFLMQLVSGLASLASAGAGVARGGHVGGVLCRGWGPSPLPPGPPIPPPPRVPPRSH